MIEYSSETVTNSELAILGLVAERPRHGYQIEQEIEGRGMREWTEIGFSSIYYVLNKLESAGWLESRLAGKGADQPQQPAQAANGALAFGEEPVQPAQAASGVSKRGPARKVYALTAAGRAVYRAAVCARLAHPRPRTADFLLALGNLPAVAPAEARAALEEQRAALAGRLSAVRAKGERDRQAARGQLPPHVEALFAYSEAMLRAELAWLDDYLAGMTG